MISLPNPEAEEVVLTFFMVSLCTQFYVTDAFSRNLGFTVFLKEHRFKIWKHHCLHTLPQSDKISRDWWVDSSECAHKTGLSFIFFISGHGGWESSTVIIFSPIPVCIESQPFSKLRNTDCVKYAQKHRWKLLYTKFEWAFCFVESYESNLIWILTMDLWERMNWQEIRIFHTLFFLYRTSKMVVVFFALTSFEAPLMMPKIMIQLKI